MSASSRNTPLPRLDLLVRDIEAAIVSQDHARQSELVLRSAATLTRHWSRLPPAHKPSFDGLLASLLDQVDGKARAAFARCLVPLRRAPRITTTRLACDLSLAVAAPLLEHCQSFDEAWLLQIVPRVGRAHRVAMARRKILGPAVTGALLHDPDPGIAAVLLANEGAAFAPETIERLLPGAAGSLPLLLALATRADLSEAGRKTLAAIARGSASRALAKEGEFDHADADDLLDQAARTLRAVSCPERLARHAVAAAIVARNPGAQAAASARIAGWLERRRLEDVLAVLARDASLPVGLLIACHDAPTPHALAMVMRGLGHPWPLLKALLHTAPGGMSVEAIGLAHRLHGCVGARAARMVMRYAAIPSGAGAFQAAAMGDEPSVASALAEAAGEAHEHGERHETYNPSVRR